MASRQRGTSGTITQRRQVRPPVTVHAKPATAKDRKSILLVVSDRQLGHERDIEDALRSAGYQLTVADDIALARALCDARSFDLLISSGGPADETVWKLTNDVRACCSGRGMILSAAGLSPTAGQALEAGYGVYVAESLDPESFLRCVQDLLRAE